MRYIFLVNRFSVKKDLDVVIKKVFLLAKSLGLDFEIKVNSNEFSTEDILNDYRDDENIIVSLGGDGTLNRVLNSIYGTKNILSVLPLGTGNDYVRSIVEQMHNGINKVDVVKINDKHFINLVCFGVDADIANDETFVNTKFIPRSQRYNAAILSNFINYNGRHMRLMADNMIYENDYTTIAVCNGKYYGGGYKMGPHAQINDGLLDVYLIDNMNKLSMIKAVMSVKTGKHENNPKTSFLQTHKLIIESEKPITCNYDGEKMTSNRFDIELIPSGINLYYDEVLQKEFAKIKVKK